MPYPRWRGRAPLGAGQEPRVRRHVQVWNDTDETRVVLFVDVLRPLPAPWKRINELIVKAIGYSPFVLDAKRNQEAWEKRFEAHRALVKDAGGRESPVESLS